MKLTGHLRTIMRHRRKVFVLCCRAGIPFAGIKHDLSKFSPSEFIPGVIYYAGGVRSPNELERLDKGYSAAWMHHKGRNRHHFEYWTDYDPVTRRVTPVKMPLGSVAELLCDRIAASKTYKGKEYTDAHPLEYFLGGKATRTIHTETSDYIEGMLTLLRDEGESAMLKRLKRHLKKEGRHSTNYSVNI